MGELNLSEPGFPDDKNYRDTVHRMDGIMKELAGRLTGEDHDAFDNYCNLKGEIITFDVANSFRSGFCAGALVMLEVMTSTESGV